jgi:hypothetical protein
VGIRHSYTATGTNNPNRQVSVDRWNEDHDFTGTAGMLLGADGVEIDPNTIGGSTGVATRAALASSTTTVGSRYLRESGREGAFVWSSSNLSTLVTADTQQGIYVAPSSDTSGASGAWVRKFTGDVNPEWFGIVRGDASGANGTANSAAFQNMLTALRSRAHLDAIYYKGVEKLRFPSDDVYEFAGDDDILDCSVVIEGATTAYISMGTQLKFPDSKSGLRFQYLDSSGLTGTRTAGQTSSYSILRNLRLVGGYSGTEGEYHGVVIRSHGVILENVWVKSFPGDGIYCSAAAGGTPEGNANNCRIVGGGVQLCRNGLFIDGADTNAWAVIQLDCSSNRAWGIWDSSFLGNTFIGCHTAGNGWAGAASSIPTACSFSSNRYFVKAGQATGASTNAPSGTTADNTWWGYIGSGSSGGGIVNWVSGTTFREGGSYKTDDPNAESVFSGCYQESDQNPAAIIAPSIVVGGPVALNNKGGNAFCLRTDTGGTPTLGFRYGARDASIEIANNNNSSIINFSRWTNGGATQNIDGKIWTASGQFMIDHVAGTKIAFRLASVEKMALTTSGLLISAAGYGLGFSTGAGTAVTQATSRTTSVTANAACGAITLVSAAGSTSWQSFTVTNSAVAATDTVRVCQKSGTDKYMIHVTKVAAGSFEVTFATTGGTTTEQPVFNFSVIKAVAA